MLIESRGLSSDSTCVLKAEPGKLDIKRRKPFYQFIGWFALQNGDYDVLVDFRVDLTSWTNAIQKVQRHDDLIKTHAVG